MSKQAENFRSTLLLISGNASVLATVFILVGLILLSTGFFIWDGTKIISRGNTMLPPTIVGVTLIVTGLIIFTRDSNKKDKTIVFYSPTIKANSFFIELLDHSIELSREKGYRFEIEKGNLVAYHDADNYLDVIKKYSKGNAANHVLIMIPPSPAAYDHIWRQPSDLKVNLITLDIEVEGHHQQFNECQFHKKIILVDNQMGAMLAANEIVSFCRAEKLSSVNIVICEGHFHKRGRMFKDEIEKQARESNLEVFFLGQFEELSFSDAVKKARNYIGYNLRRSKNELKKRDTFIFCANDNLAIGARMELSSITSSAAEEYKPIRIICFDASTFIKIHIDQNDEFFWCAIDQRYTELVREAFDSAESLLEGHNLKKEVYMVKPEIYKRYKRI